MPPIRTFRAIFECSYEDCGGSVFQTFSRHCLAYHPYDIRDRGSAVLQMRAYREAELFAQQAEPKALPPSPSSKEVDNEKELAKKKEQELGIREKTVLPAPPAEEVRILPVAKMGGKGCLEALSQLDVLPEVPPLTMRYLARNELQLDL